MSSIMFHLPGAVRLTCGAALFDMDGVLVDSINVIERHLREWAVARGLAAERVIELSHGRTNVDVVHLVAPALDAAAEAHAC